MAKVANNCAERELSVLVEKIQTEIKEIGNTCGEIEDAQIDNFINRVKSAVYHATAKRKAE